MPPLIRRSRARPAHPWPRTRRHPAEWPLLSCSRVLAARRPRLPSRCRRSRPVLYTSPFWGIVRGLSGDYLGWLRIMPDTDLVRVTVLVNGRPEEVRTEQDTALLYVLRNHLGLTGTRFGCGLGLCGACLVLIDGRPAYSCDTPMWAVADQEVTTVEGLGASGRPHPVAQAIIDGQAAQCGYCISGVVVSAAALLAANDDPSEAEVRAALDGNLCRCGAQNRIVRAVLAAAATLRAGREGG
jgi:nicotinate dehydrogenase subunit A